MAAGYSLDFRGWISGRGKLFIFSTESRPPGDTGNSFSGGKAAGALSSIMTPSSAEAKNCGAASLLLHMSARNSA
jgi:hypothetical protein